MIDPVTVAGMVQAVGLVIQACWTVGSTLYELNRERSEVSDALMTMSDEVKSMRNVLEVFNGQLKNLAQRKPDNDEYQMILVAMDGSVGACERYLSRFNSLLLKIRRPDDRENGLQHARQTLRVRSYKAELDKSRVQIQGHKLNLNLCMTMLIVHTTSEIAARDDFSTSSRQRQMNYVCDMLEQEIRQQEMTSSYEAYEAPQFFRLKETARSVLTNARSVSSRAPTINANWHDVQTDLISVQSQQFGQPERDMVEMWIQQLRAVKEEPEEMVEYTYSDLPELSSTFPTQKELSMNGNVDHSTDSSSNRPISEYEDDEYEVTLVRHLANLGKQHYDNNNRAQAIECLKSALNSAQNLGPNSNAAIDLTEIRAILASIYLMQREFGTAEQHLRALIQNSPKTKDNSAHLATAHLQLAQVHLIQRNFEEAKKDCAVSIRGRMKLYGKTSPPSFEAVQLQALICHAEGSHPQAEAHLEMLPPQLAEKTRIDMQQQALGGPRITLYNSAKHRSPGTGTRPSFSPERPTTGQQTVTSSGSNGSYPNAVDSRYSESTYGTSAVQRSFSQSATSNRGALSAVLPFRSVTQTSPRLQESVTLSSPLDSNSIKNGRAMSNPPNMPVNAELTALLSHNGFIGDFDGSKALAWAIQNGHERVVHFLLEGYPIPKPKRRFSLGGEGGPIIKQVSPNGNPKDKASPLVVAIQHGQVIIARLLLERGAEAAPKGDKRLQPMLVAAEYGSAEIIRLLYDKGVVANLSNSKRVWTAWHAAAEAGHEEVTHFFLTKTPAIDAEDPRGATALKLSAARGHIRVCELLIEHGANVNHADDTGWTPLLSSIIHGHTAVTKLLIQSGAALDQGNKKGQNPLMVAAREGRVSETTMLLSKRTPLEVTDDKSWTPLLAAARYGHVEVTQLLIQAGANVNAHCNRNSTPLDHAVKNKHRAIQQFLRGAGAHQGSGLTEPHTQNTAFTGYAM